MNTNQHLHRKERLKKIQDIVELNVCFISPSDIDVSKEKIEKSLSHIYHGRSYRLVTIENKGI